MPRMIGAGLSRREREIVDILFRLGQATAAEVMKNMPEPPTYSAVRSILRILEEKGHVRHSEDGKRYVYSPVEASGKVATSALKDLLHTFFGGSLEQAVKTLLTGGDARLTPSELDGLANIIEEAKASSARADEDAKAR